MTPVIDQPTAADEELKFAMSLIDEMATLNRQIREEEESTAQLQTTLKERRKRQRELLAKLRLKAQGLEPPDPAKEPIYALASKMGELASKLPLPLEPQQSGPMLSEIFAGMGKVVADCHLAELYTLADLQKFLSGGKTYRDIPCVGPKRAKEMEQRVHEYEQRVAATTPQQEHP